MVIEFIFKQTDSSAKIDQNVALVNLARGQGLIYQHQDVLINL